MKRSIVLLILAFILVGASGCKRKKASCAAYDKVEIEDRQH